MFRGQPIGRRFHLAGRRHRLKRQPFRLSFVDHHGRGQFAEHAPGGVANLLQGRLLGAGQPRGVQQRLEQVLAVAQLVVQRLDLLGLRLELFVLPRQFLGLLRQFLVLLRQLFRLLGQLLVLVGQFFRPLLLGNAEGFGPAGPPQPLGQHAQAQVGGREDPQGENVVGGSDAE